MSTGFSVASTTITDNSFVIGGRIVTIGYRLFYTGPAAQAQGLVLVDNYPFTVCPTPVTAALSAITQYGVGEATTSAKDQTVGQFVPRVLVEYGQFAQSQTNATADQIVLRPENGLHGVLKYSGAPDSHPFQMWYEAGALVVTVPSAVSAIPNPIYNSSNAVVTVANDKVYGAWLVDPALDEVSIYISGPGQYRLELVVCLEQELAPGNSLLDLTKPSPLMNRPILDVDALLNSRVTPAALNEAVIGDLTSDLAMMTTRGGRRRRPPRKARRQPQPRAAPAKKPTRRRRKRQRTPKVYSEQSTTQY